MIVAPHDAPEQATIDIANKDIGFVRPGQLVAVKIDAFPYNRYGTINGKVLSLSRDSVKRNEHYGHTELLQAGTCIGITGPSGSGKSTLTRLLQRLYRPQKGSILLDGMDIAIVDTSALRRNMGVVLQDNMLFAGTIVENITLCAPQATEDQIIQAAKLAGADAFIHALPQGYQTHLGEKGSGLSGGQRQRIALARALLGDPKILILDEATAALDYESEAAIMANMQHICHNRTVITIAHRLGTLKQADRILVLDQGMLVEEGTHQELLQHKGLYAKLWEIQTKGKE